MPASVLIWLAMSLATDLVFDLFEGDDVGGVEDVADGEGDLLEAAGVGGLGDVDGLGDEGLSGGEDGCAGAAVEAVDAGRDVVEVVGAAGVVEALDVEGGDGELGWRRGKGTGWTVMPAVTWVRS